MSGTWTAFRSNASNNLFKLGGLLFVLNCCFPPLLPNAQTHQTALANDSYLSPSGDSGKDSTLSSLTSSGGTGGLVTKDSGSEVMCLPSAAICPLLLVLAELLSCNQDIQKQFLEAGPLVIRQDILDNIRPRERKLLITCTLIALKTKTSLSLIFSLHDICVVCAYAGSSKVAQGVLILLETLHRVDKTPQRGHYACFSR